MTGKLTQCHDTEQIPAMTSKGVLYNVYVAPPPKDGKASLSRLIPLNIIGPQSSLAYRRHPLGLLRSQNSANTYNPPSTHLIASLYLIESHVAGQI